MNISFGKLLFLLILAILLFGDINKIIKNITTSITKIKKLIIDNNDSSNKKIK